MSKKHKSEGKKDWQEVSSRSVEEKKSGAKAQVQQEVEEEERVSGALEHPEYQKLEAMLTEMEQKADEYKRQLHRAHADLDNAHRRAERDVENAHKYGLDKFLLELLPVLDSMERGLEECQGGDAKLNSMREGMQLTLEMMLKVMEKFGVKQLDPLGEKFNPEFHEAMSIQQDDSAKPNTVLQVIQKGYTLNDRLVRPALVIVTKE